MTVYHLTTRSLMTGYVWKACLRKTTLRTRSDVWIVRISYFVLGVIMGLRRQVQEAIFILVKVEIHVLYSNSGSYILMIMNVKLHNTFSGFNLYYLTLPINLVIHVRIYQRKHGSICRQVQIAQVIDIFYWTHNEKHTKFVIIYVV